MKLGYVLLYVSDVAATLTFYEAAFGLQRRFLHETGTYGELETGGTRLGFVANTLAEANGVAFQRASPDGPAPAFEVGLTTEDVPAAYQRALDAGATEVLPPTEKPWGQTVAYVRDGNGFLVELCTPME